MYILIIILLAIFLFRIYSPYKVKGWKRIRKITSQKTHQFVRKPNRKQGLCSRSIHRYKKTGFTNWDDATMKKCGAKLAKLGIHIEKVNIKTPPLTTDPQNAEICVEARKQATLMFESNPMFSQWSFKPFIWEHYDLCGPL
jgi:hypothetical protein